MYRVGAAGQGREEPIQLLEVHGALAVEPVEGVCKAVVFRIRQGSLTHEPSLLIQLELTFVREADCRTGNPEAISCRSQAPSARQNPQRNGPYEVDQFTSKKIPAGP